MAATARRHSEGSLVYVIDQTDLYLRVREGVRQVYVQKSAFYPKIRSFSVCLFVFTNVDTTVVFPAGELYPSSWRREWLISYFSSLENTNVLTWAKNVVFRRTRLLRWNRPLWSFTHQTQTPAPPSLRAPSSRIHIHRYTTNHKTHIPNNQPTQIHTIIQIHGTQPPLIRDIQVTLSA